MTGNQVSVENLDLDAFYESYKGETRVGPPAPWDIGGPQPVLIALEDAGEISGDVLDIGCGLGGNSIFLASRGHKVTGIDAAKTAVQEASKRAKAQGVEVDFTVADATKLDGFEGRFDTVVDSALYHCLNEQGQRDYIAALHRATKPGAKLHLWVFAAEAHAPFPTVQRVTEQNLRDNVGEKFEITSLHLAEYDTTLTHEGIREMLGVKPAEGAPDAPVAFDPAFKWPEEQLEGEIKAPVWQLTAVRAG
ncbi:class I SAM-dependent methyltransferase [Streptomyces sp. LARHCF249]